MTKYEKLSIVISVGALVASLLTPIYGYYYLDPTIKAFQNRARLQVVSPPPELAPRPSSTSDALVVGPEGSGWYPLFKREVYVFITNIGELPAKDVQIVARYGQGDDIDRSVAVSPPLQYESSEKGELTFITLKRAIASYDQVKITFANSPYVITVSTEYGETSTIQTSAGDFAETLELAHKLWKSVGLRIEPPAARKGRSTKRQ